MTALAELRARAADWCRRAAAAGWVSGCLAEQVAAVEPAGPADLFAEPTRPLVVALFGGTGVGKSSLLNRLAGEAVARTGVERPTSREVTLYVHTDVKLAELPPDLPIVPIAVHRHHSETQRDILWIDAPDIDSVEEAHRAQALAWLPHVDLVVYVVSPERYRDDVGWRIVRQRGHRHGWLFVMNRWDEGDPRQPEDFAHLLGGAGFERPLILRTCCVPGRPLPAPDEFEQVARVLAELQAAHALEELDRLGVRVRAAELRAALAPAVAALSAPAAWQRTQLAAVQSWETTAATIAAGAEWSLRSAAARFADPGWLEQARAGLAAARSRSSATPAEPDRGAALERVVAGLWDDWAQRKLGAWLDSAELAAGRAGLPAVRLRAELDVAAAECGVGVTEALRDGVRAALSRPGGRWRRAARRVTGFLTAFLPLTAMLLVGVALVQGYWQAVRGARPFLGVEFAVNSVLLVVLAWAVPFALDRLLRPSLEQIVLRALRAGLRAGLEQAARALADAYERAAREAESWQRSGNSIVAEIDALAGAAAGALSPAVSRLVARA